MRRGLIGARLHRVPGRPLPRGKGALPYWAPIHRASTQGNIHSQSTASSAFEAAGHLGRALSGVFPGAKVSPLSIPAHIASESARPRLGRSPSRRRLSSTATGAENLLPTALVVRGRRPNRAFKLTGTHLLLGAARRQVRASSLTRSR